MTFHVKHQGSNTLVSKHVPIRAIKTKFVYGFVNTGLTDEEIEAGIHRCKGKIGRDIRRALIDKDVEPMRKSNDKTE